MKVAIRKYSGAGASRLMDVLEERAADVKGVIGAVEGVINYTLARADGGGFSVTVCEDQAGVDESMRKAKEWIAQNAGEVGAVTPEVTVGDVVIQLK